MAGGVGGFARGGEGLSKWGTVETVGPSCSFIEQRVVGFVDRVSCWTVGGW